MRSFERTVGVTHLVQRIRGGDGNLELALVDECGELREHRGMGTDHVSVGLGTDLGRAVPIHEGVDAIRCHAELERQVHIP